MVGRGKIQALSPLRQPQTTRAEEEKRLPTSVCEVPTFVLLPFFVLCCASYFVFFLVFLFSCIFILALCISALFLFRYICFLIDFSGGDYRGRDRVG